MDEQIAAPIGFNVIFPGMLRLAIAMGLQFAVRQTDIDRILHLWEIEVKRFVNGKDYMKLYFLPSCTLEKTCL
jgi:ent-kaurene synthase